MVNALAGRPIRPLWHLSGAGAVYANAPVNGTGIRTGVAAGRVINLCGGTVAEWTIAAALKAAGRKARGFESLPFRPTGYARCAIWKQTLMWSCRVVLPATLHLRL